MFSDKKNKKIGEHFSVAEELVLDIPATEQKCKAVEKSVAEGYFTIHEALNNYKVDTNDYAAFLLSLNRKFSRISKRNQIVEALNIVIDVFSSSNTFDKESLKLKKEIGRIMIPQNSKFANTAN